MNAILILALIGIDQNAYFGDYPKASDYYAAPAPVVVPPIIIPPLPVPPIVPEPPPPAVEGPPDGRAVVFAFGPKWCKLCPSAKQETATSEDFDFRWECDEAKFPKWVKEKGSYPLFYWRVIGTDNWRTDSGWKGLERFSERWRTSMAVQKTVQKARAQPQESVSSGGGYPTHGGMIYDFEGNRHPSRQTMIHHLLSHPNHRGKFSSAWLNSLSNQQIVALHDDDHTHHLQRSYVNGRQSQPLSSAANVGRSRARSNYCPNCPL